MNNFEMQIVNPQGGNFLRRIEWNQEALREQINAIAEKYSGELQIKTTEDKKRAKDDRATINAMLKEIDSRRKAVKAAIMEPYDIFDGEIKEASEQLIVVRDSIDEQIKAAEAEEKRAKIEQIRKYWEDHDKRPESPSTLKSLTEFERIYNTKWENTSYSLKKAYADIDEAFEHAIQDIRAIETAPEERPVKTVMLEKLVETGDIRDAFAVAARIRQREEERKRRAEQEEQVRRMQEERYQEARREREEREKQEKTAARMEALRARLSPADGPEGKGSDNAQDTENRVTGTESGQEMPVAGQVRGGSDDSGDAGAADHDAQNRPGLNPGTEEAKPEQQKIVKAAFWVAGTPEQLRALGAYIKAGGFSGYGMLR